MKLSLRFRRYAQDNCTARETNAPPPLSFPSLSLPLHVSSLLPPSPLSSSISVCASACPSVCLSFSLPLSLCLCLLLLPLSPPLSLSPFSLSVQLSLCFCLFPLSLSSTMTLFRAPPPLPPRASSSLAVSLFKLRRPRSG